MKRFDLLENTGTSPRDTLTTDEMKQPAFLSNGALIRALHAIVTSHRRATAELIAHLAEMDRRRLHVDKGFPSLFSYCVTELRFSEDEACRRIEAARLTRRFPAIAPLIESGAVSLTVLGLLKPHLSDANHVELLRGVSGSSVRQAKEWIAARFPQPDVPSSIRKIPAPQSTKARELVALPPMGSPELARVPNTPLTSPAVLPALTRVPSPLVSAAALSEVAPTPARARVEPLSEDRFLVKFTASRRLKDKIDWARDLLSHCNPSGDLATTIERAVDALITELAKRRQGKTARPERESDARKLRVASRNPTAEPPSRANPSTIPRAMRRHVVARDGWRCSFVANDGRRCDETAFLELDHRVPKALGGDSSDGNLRLLCRAHNRWAAERVFGKAFVANAIAEAQRQLSSVRVAPKRPALPLPERSVR